MACWLVVAVLFYSSLEYRFWRIEGRIIAGDVVSYYQYLPAVLIHHDITLEFAHRDAERYKDRFWSAPTETGKYVGRMTLGMSVLYAPFFLAAHGLAGPLGYERDGFSPPYKFALIISCLFYVFVGLWFLRKALLNWFSDRATAISILILGLATNLYFYAVIEPPMSHAYSFSLIACMIFLVIRWYAAPSVPKAILIGLVAGLILLVRPVNLVFLPLILLWDAGSRPALMERLILLKRNWVHLLIIMGTVFLVTVPQMLYWRMTTGHYIYYSYEKERFFFNDPHLFRGIFSYRNGWLMYTPVMIFALIGVFLTFKQHRRLYIPMVGVWLAFLYLTFSWWCWWYGGAFGMRTMIDAYALLAFPLTAFTAWVMQKKRILGSLYLTLLGLFIALNIFQTYQYYTGAIHWGSMTREAYWDSFLRKDPSDRFKSLLKHPDYGLAKKGIDAFSQFEKRTDLPAVLEDTAGMAAFIRQAEQTIRNDTAWFDLVRQKSVSKNKPVEEVLREEALWIWNKKKDNAVPE